MDWMEFAGRYGIPTLALAAVCIFFVRWVWPVVVDSWKELQQERREDWKGQQQERREERQRFLDALGAERAFFQETVTMERTLRIEERNRFLAALESHSNRLDDIVHTQVEMLHILESLKK